MAKIRAAWTVLALLGVGLAVWAAFGPVESISMSCSKSGELYLPNMPTGATCDDPMYSVLGIWPLVQVGALLAAPPALAAAIMRCSVSWLAVAVLAVLSGFGLGHWSGFWGLLLACVPMTVVALVIAMCHTAVATPTQHARPPR
ncbi:hypothetical protein VX037_18595 [Gordonia sp. Z-3]|uniref:hypothetical protein n=1 Tax=Gordonia sp. Z-3 TaxID=3115408 RepID=UPI002E2A511D|nr:hypothetical protein [Gordonia sp. Z-3]MED5803037.1 hypothetical protein [Gordonia sp. Z-3]